MESKVNHEMLFMISIIFNTQSLLNIMEVKAEVLNLSALDLEIFVM